jgi:transcriptional regulator with GAF, ATPase, and Fis domain
LRKRSRKASSEKTFFKTQCLSHNHPSSGEERYLSSKFMLKDSAKTSANIQKIPGNTKKVLENYSWPGNVRELMHVIERAVILSDGPELRLADKIGDLTGGPVPEEVPKSTEAKGTKGLVEVEREHILRTLQETAWKIEGDKGAAQILGMNPSTLRARMRKLGIERPRAG